MAEDAPVVPLGVTRTATGATIGVWSANATRIELCLFDDKDPDWLVESVPLTKGAGNVWSGSSPKLTPGRRYALRVDGPDGPRHAFDPSTFLLDPYARGVQRLRAKEWRAVVVDDAFDWGGVAKPGHDLDRTVIYEAHVKGLTKLNPELPEELRGSYAGLAHPVTIEYLKNLGITAVELLPVHSLSSEQRLVRQGLTNYWGYNTVGFFAPHALYATKAAQAAGATAVLREFKGMVKLLHEAGLEVILDVVYNHTSEEGIGGPRTSFRGIDNSSYYRQLDDGTYYDVTGCGNTVDFGQDAAPQLVLDSVRYWANACQVDGFRFDLAATLGRDETGAYTREHPLLNGLVNDPQLQGVKLIAEPWDVGLGGWQTGNFPDGWSEWNDRYRDRVRQFWLRDIADARHSGQATTGIGGFATRLAGSANTFSAERGPLASVNFVTAHDGFTLADLVSYDTKHNLGNGEFNRDGTDNNRSFNHGAEGPTTDEKIRADRRKAMRNLLGTLLLSAGVPMISAGDEFGRSQQGNNNAYCHDDELTWVSWERDTDAEHLTAVTAELTRLRRENPAVRPRRYAKLGEHVPQASQMDWYDAGGNTMELDDWQDPSARTLQYLASSTPEREAPNRILLVVHGVEDPIEVTLPVHPGVRCYTLLWDSAEETPKTETRDYAPGDRVAVSPASMQLFRCS
ncbi:glycogen debranching protein GlgX [Gryllotalpicola ginsengisoli]|uniref:glycogen debranching protein GlgX n=1 Tax=Gryllotalpicola ginsengisoli TaxID=444608 RepID=UPI0004883329|nr:glycogen debranching protein GlgX [Gryllotalpicola ginsengisoli]